MKQDEFLRRQAQATPDMPQHFSQHVEHVLDNITNSQKPRVLPRRSAALVMALLLTLFTLTAYALTQWQTFRQLHDVVGESVPSSAQSIMQDNLHTQTVNGVEITLAEAGYDGRTLLLQYSYIFPEETACQDAYDLLARYGVDWWTDEFWVNGEGIIAPGSSGSVDTFGEGPGQLLRTEYWRLDNAGVFLDGVVEITLPIGPREAGGFTFQLDTRGVQGQVTTVCKGYSASFPSFSATVEEAAFTPLMTYITLNYQDENAQSSQDPFTAGSPCLTWLYSLQLVDSQGKPVFSTAYGASVSQTSAMFYLPYADDQGEMWLAPVADGAGDMSQAIRVR